MATFVKHITFDAHDAGATAAFWAAALGFDVLGEPSEAFAVVGGPNKPADHPLLMFAKVPEGKEVKNRVHIDLETDDPVAGEIERLEQLGASRVEDKDQWGFQWTIMADPEGNEFCVAPPHH